MSIYDVVEVAAEDISEGMTLSEMFGEGISAERKIETITEEILSYKRTAGESILEIGRRLKEAKALLSHGEWLPWLSEKVEFSERSAQNFMRLADAYQNPQTLADLGASKALALLALGPVERGEFLSEKHDIRGEKKTVPEMSARELEEVVRQRKLAERKTEEMRRELERQRGLAADAEATAAKAQADAEGARAELEDAKDAAQERAAELERELKELRERPVDVAVQTVDASAEQIAAAVEETKKAAEIERKKTVAKKAEELKRAKERYDEALKAVENAEAGRKTAEERAEALCSELEKAKKSAAAMGNKALAEFGVLFRQTQETVNRMTELAMELDEEYRPKAWRALDALRSMIAERGGE